MRASTWRAIAASFRGFPENRAEGVSESEIHSVSKKLGVAFPNDYLGFLKRYGGGGVGAYPIAGLRRWANAADDEWNVEELTFHFRQQGYPGTERWVIFSDDGFGNPIGFDGDGRIWLSDHNSAECVGLEVSFEDWFRAEALEISTPSDTYFAQEAWPKEILAKLRENQCAGTFMARSAVVVFCRCKKASKKPADNDYPRGFQPVEGTPLFRRVVLAASECPLLVGKHSVPLQ